MSSPGAGNDWLSQLAPDHAPPPPGWWPPAPGWWLVAIIAIAAIVALAVLWRMPSRRQRRAALREIDRLETTVADDGAFACQLEHLLRRYAVTRFGRASVANLSSERWIDFLVRHGSEDWRGAAGTDLLRLAYGGSAKPHRDAWLKGARTFVKSRRKAMP